MTFLAVGALDGQRSGPPQDSFLSSSPQMRAAAQAACSALRPSILAETSEWLAINKPALWHSVAPGERRAKDPADRGSTIEEWLRATRPEQGRLRDGGLVQRLDFGTSGCMLAAKSEESHAVLHDQIGSERGVNKTYLAVVHGSVEPTSGSFSLWFFSRYRGSQRVSVSAHEAPRARPGRCEWRTVHRALLADSPGGRAHQPVSTLEAPARPLPRAPRTAREHAADAGCRAPRSPLALLRRDRPSLTPRGRSASSAPGHATRSAPDSRT